ncbi:pyridoxamine 5'-phosphate oxidase family protein [Sphingomonas azotifigens]|uniref:pyridoxamine 5'-phosphate oxidase family protein n=1 Tax=Sphingomonas azotifigens TaxID=330920 RepID=UPI000A031745|nr:pyridoxamine 5'-phosphate oxidase family protein [Sphingomonas azotifigens]
MPYGFMDVARTPGVAAVQAEMGVGERWTRFKSHRASDRFTPDEAAFLAQRDSFYIASVSETGWPYVQHRGGPAGFLKMLDPQTLAFADYRGNRQYISTGNFRTSGRACLILMDYVRRARLKMYVQVETLAPESDRALTERVTDGEYGASIERIFRLRLVAFDWNCPQHIVPRFSEREIATAVQPLHDRLTALERENAELRQQLAEP